MKARGCLSDARAELSLRPLPFHHGLVILFAVMVFVFACVPLVLCINML